MKFNKDMEQALRSLAYLDNAPEQVNTRAIALALGIPFEKLSKVLQRLASHGIIEAHRGRQGGYLLSRNLENIKLQELYSLMEESPSVVPCMKGESCKAQMNCQIMAGMKKFQRELNGLMDKFTLADFTRPALNDQL